MHMSTHARYFYPPFLAQVIRFYFGNLSVTTEYKCCSHYHSSIHLSRAHIHALYKNIREISCALCEISCVSKGGDLNNL